MALNDEWREVIREWESERLIGGHDTVKRRSHAKRLAEYKPSLTDEMKARPCMECGEPRGEAGLTGFRCGPCEADFENGLRGK